MLNKILSNLVLSSGHTKELEEYNAKAKRDKKLRGLGVFFIALALIVQVFAMTSTPKSGATGSNNDLLYGGVTSARQIYNDCLSGYDGAQGIYAYYGVYCSDIQRAVDANDVVSLRSTDYSDSLWSVGHLPYALRGETPVTISGSVNGNPRTWTLYWRPLHSWDTGAYSTYTALKVTGQNGKIFFILFSCGNLVSIHFPSRYIPPSPPASIAPPPKPPVTPPPPKPEVCPYNSAILESNSSCKPCNSSLSLYDAVDCLGYSKQASNVTQNISDADGTTANPGDVLQFTLTVTNPTTVDVKDFVVQENISDDLDYADPVSLGGGTLASSGVLSWPAQTVAAKSSVTETYTLQVKNPVPTTPAGTDNPDGYNFVMTDVYGNTININVAKPATVAVAQTAATSLPNTGPGAGVFIFAALAVASGYLYFRSRLLVSESAIAIDYAGKNGGDDE